MTSAVIDTAGLQRLVSTLIDRGYRVIGVRPLGRSAVVEAVPASAATEAVVIGLPEAYALGEPLGRLPDRLVVLGVNVVDVSYGVGLTPAVSAAVPAAVEAVLAELSRSQ